MMRDLKWENFSTYGIQHERLWAHYEGLVALGLGRADACPFVRMSLYLGGLHYATSYLRASKDGSEFETHWGPVHAEDDGLPDAARLLLQGLVRLARSRSLATEVRHLRSQNPDVFEPYYRLQQAWVVAEQLNQGRVHTWMRDQPRELGWVRLSTAAGIISLWHVPTVTFCSQLLKKCPVRMPIAEENHGPLVAHLRSLTRDHTLDMEEPPRSTRFQGPLPPP